MLLTKYKYLILFPIVVFEGPFVTIISGFLVSIKIFNVLIAYPIIILGDLGGDTIFYCLGRWGKKYVLKYRIFGVTEEKLNTAEKYFGEHHNKAIAASKLIHGIGLAGLLSAGALKIPFGRYLRTCLWVTMAQSGALLLIGFFSGYAYVKVFVFLDNYAKIISGTVSILIIGLFVYYKYIKKYDGQETK